MLRNQEERSKYLTNQNNWKVVGDFGGLIRLVKLDKVNLYKLEHYAVSRYMGNGWKDITSTAQYMTIYKEGDQFGMNSYVTKHEALKIIKDTEEAPGVKSR